MGTARTPSLALCAALGLALASCGSGTKTVTVASSPASAPGPTTQTTPTQHGTTPKTTPSPSATAPTTTRSAPAPAFTEQEHKSEGLGSASAVLRARGYTPTKAADYHPKQALQVLIGMHIGSGDGYGQQAFFFVNGRYLGTDASAPSATLRIVSQGDTEATLAYPLYRANDALCCPSGGQAQVHFQLNNGKLTPLDPIPALRRSKTGLSRY
jgi:LppP/LprE lipoprotein